MWSFLKGAGIVIACLAALLAFVTMFFIFGLAIRIIAVLAAVLGVVCLVGFFMYMAFDEKVIQPYKARKNKNSR